MRDDDNTRWDLPETREEHEELRDMTQEAWERAEMMVRLENSLIKERSKGED
jgi:hypothetical protein